MKCKNLRIRTEKGKKYGLCLLKNKRVSVFCNECAFDIKYNKDTIKQIHGKSLNKKSKKHNLTKATEIPKKVKLIVWKRDDCKCIFCDTPVPWNMANSHFIKRSQLGLGIEENIMTNCFYCHEMFEKEAKNGILHEKARKHFKEKYQTWNEKKLIYKKYPTDYG